MPATLRAYRARTWTIALAMVLTIVGITVIALIDERASARDLVGLVASLPVAPFVWAAARWLWRRLRAPPHILPPPPLTGP